MRRPILLAFLLAFLALAPTAQADKTISEAGEGAGQTQNPQGLATDFETGRLYVADQGNNRVDVFDSAGSFLFAFGWGVADGKAELQGCGPAATPPTAKCRKGLAGGGAGEFGAPVDRFHGLSDIAVDNDPASPSHHDVYALDGPRVQKFDPEGHFLLTFGGGVITGGADGTGSLVSGSTEVTNVKTTAKAFDVAQTITGLGIPAGTTIIGLGNGTITLSKAATASGAGVALSVAAGPGNKPTNEIDTLVNKGIGSPNVVFNTSNPSASESELGQSLPSTANAAELQAVLEALPNIGSGNVKVSCAVPSCAGAGAEDHEYTIEFTGLRFADTNTFLRPGNSLGGRKILTVQNGAGSAEVCTAAIAASCSGGIEGTGHGQSNDAVHLALGPGGTVYVVDCGAENPSTGGCEDRLQKFDPSGAFVEELALPQSQSQPNGLAVDSSGDFYVSVNDALRKYDSAGNPIEQLPVGSEVGALAIDAFDNLFAAEGDGGRPVIAEHDSAGNTLRRFGYYVLKAAPRSLAPKQSPSGGIYAAESNFAVNGVLKRSFPSAGPIVVPRPCATSFLGNSKATLLAEVNPEGKATTFQFQYVDQKSFEDEGGFKSKNARTTASESIGSDFFLHDAKADADLIPETKYHCRVVATNADALDGIEGPEGTFTSLEPLEIGTTTVSKVATEAATLNAEVNPLGIPASGYFEYVEEATYLKDIAELGPEHGFEHAAKAPNVGASETPIEFGASESFTAGSANVSGLKPGTSYRFRIVVTDVRISPKEIIGQAGPSAPSGKAPARCPTNAPGSWSHRDRRTARKWWCRAVRGVFLKTGQSVSRRPRAPAKRSPTPPSPHSVKPKLRRRAVSTCRNELRAAGRPRTSLPSAPRSSPSSLPTTASALILASRSSG